MQIRFNLSVLEQWCRESNMPNCNEVIDQLNPITQATKLLQTKKTEDNISTIVEMCNKLTSSQICKLLNLYTSVDEENISGEFLKKMQEYLKEHRTDCKLFFLYYLKIKIFLSIKIYNLILILIFFFSLNQP